MARTPLTLAVCLFPRVCPTDFQGPVELLSALSPEHLSENPFRLVTPVSVEATYLAPTREPVKGSSGPLLSPSKAYEEVKEDEQFDIILVPGGMFSGDRNNPWSNSHVV